MDEPFVLPPGDEPRDWAELPWDALSVVFDKIGAVAVLFAAQAVCRPWRKLALEPSTWLKVDMRFGFYDYEPELKAEEMAIAAVDRSAGRLQEFYIEGYIVDELLERLGGRCPELKRLHLACCTQITNETLIEASKGFGSLEELQITDFQLRKDAFESIGRSCPNLKRFGLNCVGFDYYYRSEYNKEAMAIAKYMPQLHELELFGNRLNDEALCAILDGCPRLEFLDLRGCFNINIDQALKHRLKALKTLKRPRDPVDDYRYQIYLGPDFSDLEDDYADYADPDYDFNEQYDYFYPEQYDLSIHDFTRAPELYGFNVENDSIGFNLMFSEFSGCEFQDEDDDF